jgi:hypothetical protein
VKNIMAKCPDCGRNIAKPAGQIDTCEVKCMCNKNKRMIKLGIDEDDIEVDIVIHPKQEIKKGE